ncbi:MAG TPA: arsenate reductase ArsC [Methanobacterium sp.]|nr:arsenate reductase ArsC [Methanobacterium sp.]
MANNSKNSVLFICRNNSGRSQMAEGLLKHIYGDKCDVYSAGSDPKRINPLTIETMAEIGIDISNQTSTHLKEYHGQRFDYVVTLCDDGECPVFIGGKKYIYHEFKDPKTYHKDNMEKIDIFRLIREEIKDWIENSFIINVE